MSAVVDVALRIHQLLMAYNRPNSETITLPKQEVIDLADALYESAVADSGLSARLDDDYMHSIAEDERVASATIDRLIRNAQGHGSVLTKDEAWNLHEFFEMHKITGIKAKQTTQEYSSEV